MSDEVSFSAEDAAAGQRRVQAQFADPGIAGDELRDKIRVQGVLDYRKQEDGAIKGSLKWFQVKNRENEETRDLPGSLDSAFTMKGTAVQSGQTISAKGDVEGALAAARALLEQGGERPAEKEVEEKSSGSGRSATAPYTAAGTSSENSMLDGFKLPTDTEKAVEEKIDDIGLTDAGCPIKISEDKTMAYVQSQSTKNGTPQGDCSPNGTNLQITKSYASCEDIVELEERTAWASYRRFYVDQGGTTQYVDDACQKDEELKFAMVQDDGVCTFQLDYSGASPMARNRGKWMYLNKNNNRVEVSGCEPIEDETAPIVATTKGCVPRHDFDAGISHEQARQYYIWEDIERLVSECDDTGVTMVHMVRDNVCSDLTPTQADLANYQDGDAPLVAVAQERIAILLDGKETWITECQPADSQANLVKDPAGCGTTFFHYVSSGQSFGSTKWKYQLEGKPEITMTSCIQDNDVPYTHQVRINGYEHHDTQLYSFPKTEIYIETEGGEVMVSGPQVRTGAPELPYVFQQSVLLATGELFYESESSCEQFMRRNDVDRYLKGDMVSVYDHVKGEGEALSQGDGCDPVVTWDEPMNDRWGVSFGYGHNSPIPTGDSNYSLGPSARCGSTRAFHKRDYRQSDEWRCRTTYVNAANHCSFTTAKATRKIVRTDGQVIGEPATNTCSLSAGAPSVYTSTPDRSCDSTARYVSPGYPAYPVMTNAEKSNCLGAWGWW